MNKQHPLYREDIKRIICMQGIDTLHGMSILITGATGLIGVCIIDALMLANESGANITIYDML